MRIKMLSLSTFAAIVSLSAMASSASARATEEQGGQFDYGFCNTYKNEDQNWRHKFLGWGGCFNYEHLEEQAGPCTVHDSFPCFYCVIGC